MKWSDDLVEADFHDHAVWSEVSAEPGQCGWQMRPVKNLPARSLAGCWVGAYCQLSNGQQQFFVLRFVDDRDVELNKHFVTLIAFVNGRQVQLRRYHSPDANSFTPRDFASALGLSLESLFPVRYDLTSIAIGNPDALKGVVHEPFEQPLSEDELVELTLSSLERTR